MYFWKCWRDTRKFFFGYLAGLVACGLGTVLFRVLRYREPNVGWYIQWDWTPVAAKGVWLESIYGLAVGAWIVVAIAGLTLGAATIGDEFQQKTLEFLLTRPRQRRYFVWTNWLSGALELLTMTAAAILSTMLLLLIVTRTLATWEIWTILPLFFVTALVFYSLTFFLTTLVGNGRNGSGYALATVFLYAAVSFLLEQYAKLHLPAISKLLAAVVKPEEPYPFTSLITWLLFALACPLASQWLFDRADV